MAVSGQQSAALKQLQINMQKSNQQVEQLSRQLWMKKPQVCLALTPAVLPSWLLLDSMPVLLKGHLL